MASKTLRFQKFLIKVQNIYLLINNPANTGNLHLATIKDEIDELEGEFYSHRWTKHQSQDFGLAIINLDTYIKNKFGLD